MGVILGVIGFFKAGVFHVPYYAYPCHWDSNNY